MDTAHFWNRSSRRRDHFKYAAVFLVHLRELYGSAWRWNSHRYSRQPLWTGSRIIGTKRLGTMAPRRPRGSRNGSHGSHGHGLCRSISATRRKNVRSLEDDAGRSPALLSSRPLHICFALGKNGDPAYLRFALCGRGSRREPCRAMEIAAWRRG